MRVLKTLSAYCCHVFSLDYRSLAVFRIGLGTVILYDLLLLLPDLDAFLGPNGTYPASLFTHDPHMLCHWSFHALGPLFFVKLLFAFNAALAVCLILGYRTTAVTFLCWLFSISLAHRNPLAMYLGRDYALILFLMWGMFLPLGRAFAVDALKNKTAAAGRVVSVASAGLILSLIMIYLLCGWLKTHPSWTKDLNALNYVFNNSDLATPLGTWLLRFPLLLKALAGLTVALERFGILLILFPLPNARFKGLLVLIFMLFHAALYATTIVEWFSLIMITAWAALIPSSWWSKQYPAVHVDQNIWRNAVAGLTLLLIILCNYKNADGFFHPQPKSIVFTAAQPLGLDFPWRLFCPSPPLERMDYVLAPIFENPGQLPADAMARQRFLERFQLMEKHSYRWKFLIRNENAALLPHLKTYLLRYWSARYPDTRIIGVNVYYQRKKITPG